MTKARRENSDTQFLIYIDSIENYRFYVDKKIFEKFTKSTKKIKRDFVKVRKCHMYDILSYV